MENDEIRYGAAAEYIRRLTGDENTPVTFQVFDDTPAKDKRKARVYNGTLRQHFDRLVAHNDEGCGIFCTVNETDLKGRGKDNIVGIRAILADDDDGANAVDGFPLRPHMAVRSSRTNGIEKKQFYWTTSCGDFAQYDGVIERLIADYKVCPGAKGINRVLRVPGFYHQKNPEDPQMVEIIHMTDAPPYPWPAIVKAFPPIGNGHFKANRLQAAFENDPVLTHLRAGGFVNEERPDGKIHIVCPFEENHTEPSSVSSTTYFVAYTNGYRFGHFKCQHAHCAQRTREDFLAAIGYEPPPSREPEVAPADPPPITTPQELRRCCAVILDGRHPTEDFDTSELPDVLRNYISELRQTADAAAIMLAQSVFCTASGFIRGSVYLPEEISFQKLFPNLWCVSVIKSGGFKSTAVNKGARACIEAESRINERIQVYQLENSKLDAKKDKDRIEANEVIIGEIEGTSYLFPQKVTPEALLELLSKGYGGMIILTEIGEWLANMTKTHNADLRALYTDIYDSPAFYKYVTRHSGRFTISYPFLTINSVSAVRWINQYINPGDVESGFFARFLLFAPPQDDAKIPLFLSDERCGKADYKAYDKFKENLFATKRDSETAFGITPEARKAYRHIHDEMYRQQNKMSEQTREIINPYIKRWNPYILKLAMLSQLFIDPQSTMISEDAILAGHSVVRYAVKSTTYLFEEHLSKTPMQIKMDNVLSYIARKGGRVVRHNLLVSKVLGGGVKDYEYVIDSLIERGQIAVDRTEKKNNWTYYLQDGEVE